MDPDQTALFVKVALHYTVYDLCCIGARCVNKCNGQDFHKMYAR